MAKLTQAEHDAMFYGTGPGSDYHKISTGTFPLAEVIEECDHWIAEYKVEDPGSEAGYEAIRAAFQAMTPDEYLAAQAQATAEMDAELHGDRLNNMAIYFITGASGATWTEPD